MANFEDLTAKRFGRLIVIARAESKVEPSNCRFISIQEQAKNKRGLRK